MLAAARVPEIVYRAGYDGPDGHRWVGIELDGRMAEGEFRPGDTVLADLDRAGFEDAAFYLFFVQWDDGSVTTLAGHVRPFTRQGTLRKRLILHGMNVALETETMGRRWWPCRARWRVRPLVPGLNPGMTVRDAEGTGHA